MLAGVRAVDFALYAEGTLVMLSSRILCRGLLIASLALVLGAALPLAAQGVGATLSGNVTDPSGASIPGAVVTAKNEGTGATRTVNSDAHGFYNLANLQPGEYDVTYSATGFVKQVRPRLTLTVGEQLAINAKLVLGSTSQVVQVTGEAPAVQVASSTVSQTINSQTIQQLPLNGRSWTDLATLEPGVSNPQMQPPFNGGRGQRGFGSQISISGRRPQDNDYRIDGISVEDYMNGGPGNVEGGALGVDAVQEFSVLTGTYPAEYGDSSGGVINAITRSGTNSFHGSLYEYIRNSSLDAANYFDCWGAGSGCTKPPLNRNQFGGSAGGPIQKNKTFIFGDYEAIREVQSLSAVDVVPSAAARAGNLSTGTVTPDAYAQKFMNTFFPQPNGAVTGDTGIYSFAGRQINNENFFTGRLDHHFSANDILSGTLEYDKNNLNSPDEFNQKRANYGVQHELYALQETHIFDPNLMNSMRLGIYRTPAQVGVTTPVTAAAGDTKDWDSVPGHAAPDVKIGGLTEFTGGVGAPSFYDFHYTTIQFYDDISQTAGDHSLKYGFEAQRIRDNLTAATDGNGVYSYGSLSSFLTNAAPHNYTALLGGGVITGRSVRQSVLGAYVQDDWRLRSNLTVNMGLRYEYASIPTETHGDLAILPTLSAAQDRCGRYVPGACNPNLTGGYYLSNPTKYDFEPRFGVSWDPTGHGTTAIRSGFGMYDILPLPYMFNLEYVFTAPYFQEGVTNAPPAGSFTNSANPSDAYYSIASSTKTLRNAFMDQYPKRSYVMQYDLNIEHQFTPSMSLMVGYVGDGGVHEPFRSEEVNGVVPTNPNVLVWPTNTTNNDRVNPNWGVIRGLMFEGKSNYNALETQLNRRMSHGVQMTATYTWSHAIDDGTDTVAGDTNANAIPGLFWFNLHADRGTSDLNVGQTFMYNVLWQLPNGNSLPSVAKAVVGGWQVGSILHMSSGAPFTLTISGDRLGQFASHPWDVPNVNLSAPGCGGSLYQAGPYYINPACFSVPSPANVRGDTARNGFTGPNDYDLDLSLVKNIPVHVINESSNLELRIAAFNILNHPNFNPPVDNTDMFDAKGNALSSGGLIDSTWGTSRQMQLALKLTW
ncbi:MAG: TonB-dependent receptor [Acidobacteria bacterium]|nr:MAG: TonB-dependent receptor [Acidobacteriota bacterium]